MGFATQVESFTRVLAHRGAHDVAGVMENTLPAFERAAKKGAVLELDVHRTLDGVLVIHHDAKLADGRKIKNLASTELPQIWGPGGISQPIPRLSEVVDIANQHGVSMAVELKAKGIAEQTVTELQSVLPNTQFEIISFSPKALQQVHGMDASIRTGMLAPRIPGFLRESALYPGALWVLDKLHAEPALSRAAKSGANYVSVDYRMATPRFLAAAEKRGIPVDVWTVNNTDEMRRLVNANVQSIVTDKPVVAQDLVRIMRGHLGEAQRGYHVA